MFGKAIKFAAVACVVSFATVAIAAEDTATSPNGKPSGATGSATGTPAAAPGGNAVPAEKGQMTPTKGGDSGNAVEPTRGEKH